MQNRRSHGRAPFLILFGALVEIVLHGRQAWDVETGVKIRR